MKRNAEMVPKVKMCVALKIYYINKKKNDYLQYTMAPVALGTTIAYPSPTLGRP
jgi:hypothetical protein